MSCAAYYTQTDKDRLIDIYTVTWLLVYAQLMLYI